MRLSIVSEIIRTGFGTQALPLARVSTLLPSFFCIWTTAEGNPDILDAVRKVTTLGVACMEQNGAPHREV